jgi:outer membrane lipopolysaccharide assembly protein LptE/RlpB
MRFRQLLFFILLLMLQACGFHPRGTLMGVGEMPSFSWQVDLVHEPLLRQSLRFASDSEYRLKIDFPVCLKRPIGFDAQGYNNRMEMTCRLQASVTQGEGESEKVWLKPSRFVASREYLLQASVNDAYERDLQTQLNQQLINQLVVRLNRIQWPVDEAQTTRP